MRTLAYWPSTQVAREQRAQASHLRTIRRTSGKRAARGPRKVHQGAVLLATLVLFASDLARAQQHQPQQQQNAQQMSSSEKGVPPQQQQTHRLPPHSKCLISAANGAGVASANLSSNNSYLSALNFRPFKLKEPQPTLSTGPRYLDVPPSNNSARLFGASGAPQASSSQSRASSPLLAFETICSGWRNSLQPARHVKQPAYWVLDRRRGALVAKFDYFAREEFLDPSRHEAHLSSPPFGPIAPFHFRSESRYFNSCRISFRSYMTLRAHLELTLLPVGTAVAAPPDAGESLAGQQTGAAVAPTATDSAPQSGPQKLLLLTKVDELDARQRGEQAAWRDQQVSLPISAELRWLRFVLEFSAMPSVIKQDSLQQQSYMNGVAIANFSLSPQCFGFDVDEAEWQRLRAAGENVDAYLKLRGQDMSYYVGNEPDEHHELHLHLLRFIEQHKMSILISVIFVLAVVLVVSQWLLCTYLHGSSSVSAAHWQRQRATRSPKSSWQWLRWKLENYAAPLCCYCYCCCCRCCRLRARRLPAGRDRIYATHDQSVLNGKISAGTKFSLVPSSQHSSSNNYLRPISASFFEDVELNVNPNYIANGTQANNHLQLANGDNKRQSMLGQHAAQHHLGTSIKLPANNPLEPYYIDRKRLTLTKPLGKGAFGEVYQGYLVCHCSDDGKTLLAGQQQDDDDSLESHSLKVAVKTLTDERMSEIDFVREAINMSLVSHRNIVELMGVCFDEKPLYIVMELMQGGNLKNFLLRNRDKNYTRSSSSMALLNASTANSETATSRSSDSNAERVQLSMGDLLVYALDIARACNHLQKLQFIHRDLAARNCLLSASARVQPGGSNYIQTQTIFPNSQHNQSTASSSAPLIANEQQLAVSRASSGLRTFVGAPPSASDVQANHKIDLEQVYLNGYASSGIVAKLADFGMTRDVYSNDYYRVGHKELPVRWMPPECLDGVATTKSDVWSFGVFLWELFSMGQLPYQQLLDNHQVVQFIRSRRHARARPAAAAGGEPASGRAHDSIARTVTPLTTADDASNEDNEDNAADELQQEPADMPPLPPPHDNTPHPIYAIMCACWATNPEERPQFEEIANRLYWCLQMPDVLATSLPCFYEQYTPSSCQAAMQLQQASARAASLNAMVASRGAEDQVPTLAEQAASQRAELPRAVSQLSQTAAWSLDGDQCERF